MKKSLTRIPLDLIERHPYHEKVYEPSIEGFLTVSMKRTDEDSVYPLVVLNRQGNEKYKLLSGGSRYDSLYELGKTETEVLVVDLPDEKSIRNLIVDLNKQRIKTGRELYFEFDHHRGNYLSNRGKTGKGRVKMISLETGINHERVKKLLRLVEKFGGTEYEEHILYPIFEGKLSILQGLNFLKLIEKCKVKPSEELVEKMVKNSCDFKKLSELPKEIDIENPDEFEIFKPYLQGKETDKTFNDRLGQLSKKKDVRKKHDSEKSPVILLTEEYKNKNSQIFLGDSTDFDVKKLRPVSRVRAIVGSCEYGYGTKRKSRENDKHEMLSNMNSREFAEHLAKTYERYLPILEEDGSIYIIVFDYHDKKNHKYALFPEHLVIEMEKKGMYLVGRKIWVKNNPLRMPLSHKDDVESYEFIYRFSSNPEKVYKKPHKLILDESKKAYGLSQGCTNHSNKGTSSRGSRYIQTNLKKTINVLTEGYAEDIIRCNVGNPGDFFNQLSDVPHTSVSPIPLTASLILESTEPGDTIMDIWNGSGNTMLSSLMIGRRYMGIEIENEYFEQSTFKADAAEEFVDQFNIMEQMSISQEIKQVA